MYITQAYQTFQTPLAYSHTHAVGSRIAVTHHVNASRLQSTFMINLARHTHNARTLHMRIITPHTTRIIAHTPTNHASRSRIALTLHVHDKARTSDTQNISTSHAHQKLHTQHAYSHTRRRITLTHHAHASRSCIALTLHVHNKSRMSYTLTANAHYTRMKISTQHTHIRTHTPSKHAHATRISLTHYVYTSCSRSTFTMKLTRHAKRTHNARTLLTRMKSSTHHTYIRTHADELCSRFKLTRSVYASVRASCLRSTFIIKLAHHTHSQHMPITHAYPKLNTPHAYSHTHAIANRAHASRISLTHYVRARRLRSTIMI
jgi:hypothetical protein